MKKIFLISGKAQSGKDSTAIFLKQKLDGKTLIIHNADYLKYIATTYMDWNGEKNDEWRSRLQILGTEQTKIALNKPFFWTEKVCDVIEILKDQYDYFAIPDTRFLSEIYYPLARYPKDIITIRVHRLRFDNGLTEEQKNHISETELDYFKFNYDIYSTSGLDNLEKEVGEFIFKYKEMEGNEEVI